MAKKDLSFYSFWAETPTITVNRLKGSDNYQSCANFVILWFTRNGVEDHLTSTESSVNADKCPQWQKHDALLCNIIQQSIESKALDNFGDYQTCQPLWTQLRIYIPMMFNTSTVSYLLLIVWSSLVWNNLPLLGECLH